MKFRSAGLLFFAFVAAGMSVVNGCPGPEPTPAKATHFVVIYESRAITTEQAAILASEEFRTHLAVNSWSWYIFDQDVSRGDGVRPAELSSYVDLYKGHFLPQVFLATESGQICKQTDLPITVEGLISLLRFAEARR